MRSCGLDVLHGFRPFSHCASWNARDWRGAPRVALRYLARIPAGWLLCLEPCSAARLCVAASPVWRSQGRVEFGVGWAGAANQLRALDPLAAMNGRFALHELRNDARLQEAAVRPSIT